MRCITLNRAIVDGDYTREEAVSGNNAQVTSDLSLNNRLAKLDMMIMAMK